MRQRKVSEEAARTAGTSARPGNGNNCRTGRGRQQLRQNGCDTFFRGVCCSFRDRDSGTRQYGSSCRNRGSSGKQWLPEKPRQLPETDAFAETEAEAPEVTEPHASQENQDACRRTECRNRGFRQTRDRRSVRSFANQRASGAASQGQESMMSHSAARTLH